MGAQRPLSVVLMPCPECGGTPRFTQCSKAEMGQMARSYARFLCDCGFEGFYENIDSVEACIAAWNKHVASENLWRREHRLAVRDA